MARQKILEFEIGFSRHGFLYDLTHNHVFFIETYLDFYEFTKVKAKNAVNMEFTLGKSPEEIPNLPTHSNAS